MAINRRKIMVYIAKIPDAGVTFSNNVKTRLIIDMF